MIPNRIARLDSNGATDTSFDPGAGLDAEGICVNLDAAGQVIAGGSFNMVSGSVRAKLALFEADGTLITGTPTPSATVRTLVTQVNGKIILGGDFTTIDGTTRNRVARLQNDYTLEAAFNPDANGAIHACALQEDGKILVGGAITQVGASTRNGVARLYNDPASNVLSVPSLSEVQWLRSGATQEAQRVTFEKDIGVGYVTDGITVSRIDGGWKATITPDLVTGLIRARAFPSDSHSEGMIEEIVSFVVAPAIEVSVGNIVRTSGVGTLDFGSRQTGVASNLVVNIVNRGLDDLTLTSAVLTSTGTPTGTNWSIPTQPSSPVAPGGLASFTLAFNAATPGAKTDTVTINSDDPTTPAFTISLAGVGTPGPGALDTTWQPVPNGLVTTVSRSSTDLTWVGGDFTTISAFKRGRYAFLNDSAVVQNQAGVGTAPATSALYCIAQLPDGKVMLGGTFTHVNGVARRGIARLNADGSVDPSFASMGLIAGEEVWCFALQPDGALLVGGMFGKFGGVPSRSLARLTPAGAIDTTFTYPLVTAVRSVSVQADNKILVSGFFYQPVSQGVVRINPNGSIDDTFTPGFAGSARDIQCIAVDSTGKILLSGQFTEGAVSSYSLKRVTSTGALDATFVDNAIIATSLVIQTDGNIVVAGSGYGVTQLFRLTTLGVDDTSFGADVRNTLFGAALISVEMPPINGVAQPDEGRVLVGGMFNIAGQGAIRYLARMINGPVSSSLTVVGPAEIIWERSGTLPECQTVVFDLSQDSGVSWNRLGQGTRISGGWRIIATSIAGPLLPGFFFGSLPVSGTIRARAYVQAGYHNGSVSILEEQRTFSGLPSPDLILQVGANEIAEGGIVQFNPIFGGTNTTTSVTLSNIGGADLNSVSAAVFPVGGGVAGEFIIVSTPATTISAGGSTTLGVQFAPAANIVGYRSAFLRITSSNPGLKNPYDVTLNGTAITAPTAATVSPATAIAAGAATFTGTFKANHDAATAYFQYKLVSATNWINSGSSTLAGFTPTTVTKTVTGLTAGQLYHFRAVIYNTANNITTIPTTGGNLSPTRVNVGAISASFTALA